MEKYLEKALAEFEQALIDQGVYDQGHANLRRAFNGASDFVKFLVHGPKALRPRPPRSTGRPR